MVAVADASAEGTIEGAAWMKTVLVLVEVRPFSSAGELVDGVGCFGARVDLDRVHRRAVDVGRDAEIEVGFRAGDGSAEVVS